MDNDLREKFKKIKLLAMDFDGVMTDGYVYVNQNGKESVKCSRKDGLGVEMLRNAGVYLAVISKEENPVVLSRCKKLKIDCWNGVSDGASKLRIFLRILEDKKIFPEEAAYMGDDLNDLEALERAGLAITVADGHKKIKNICHYTTMAKGGEHAVREVCEQILQSRKVE